MSLKINSYLTFDLSIKINLTFNKFIFYSIIIFISLKNENHIDQFQWSIKFNWKVIGEGLAGISSTSMAAALFLLLLSLGIPSSLAYRPGDIVPMSRMGQYHAVISHPLYFYEN